MPDSIHCEGIGEVAGWVAACGGPAAFRCVAMFSHPFEFPTQTLQKQVMYQRPKIDWGWSRFAVVRCEPIVHSSGHGVWGIGFRTLSGLPFSRAMSSLRNRGFGDDDVDAIVAAQVESRAETLDLSGNQLGERGGGALADRRPAHAPPSPPGGITGLGVSRKPRTRRPLRRRPHLQEAFALAGWWRSSPS